MTEHFSLEELTASDIARRRGIANEPKADDVRRLRQLCLLLLEPLREVTGPLRVTSGYRSAALNVAVGGTRDSAHRYGCAADVVPANFSVGSAWAAAQRLGLPYDQCIWERRGETEWLHIALPRPGETARGQAFRIWR